jgi:hypothetical protein
MEKQQESAIPELLWIGSLTRLMDSRFRFPGTQVRFGLDPLFGLVPFLGDIISLLISSLMVMAMVRHGVSSKVVILMLLNIGLDFLVGFIPFLGDIFDFFHRANTRNFRLMQAYYEEGEHKGSGWWIIWMILLFIVVMVVTLIWLAFKLLAWTYELL